MTFNAANEQEVRQEVARLGHNNTVLAVGHDQRVTALTVNPADDPYYPPSGPNGQDGQWGFAPTKLDFATAWNTNNVDGAGVRVAVIDTGVQAQPNDHRDLFANIVAGKDFVASDAASDFARKDGDGHGTHVAGIVAAVDNTQGVVGGAPHATIVPVRVLDCSGSGTYANVEAGILWASDSIANGGGGARVINLSLGGLADDPALHAAVQTAVNRGVVVAAAAGNCGTSGACQGPGADEPNYPGAYAEVVAVGAINPDGTKASYSNNNTYIDIAAPGTHVISTYSSAALQPCTNATSGYCYLSGTSMATPHIAALAALLVQACPASDHTTSAWTSWVSSRITSTAWSTAISGFAGTVKLANAGAATAAGSCPA